MHHDDLIMTRTTVQRDKTKDKVDKLCYAIRGLLQIILGTGRRSYIVRKVNESESPKLKFMFMSEDLYILQPSLKLYEPISRSDTRYLNESHTPIVNLLKYIYTLNYITKYGLTNHLKPSPHHLNMIIPPYHFL